MNSKLWIRKALTLCSLLAVFATSSMVALAGAPGKATGELTVTGGKSVEDSVVMVNGEPARSGRTLISPSTITTAEATGATINLGKAGRLQLAPGTTFLLNFDADSITGDLSAGSVTVLNAARGVKVNVAGEVRDLASGETATAGASAAQTTNTTGGTGPWWAYALILGGAAVGIIWAAMSDNENRFGSGAVTISPTR